MLVVNKVVITSVLPAPTLVLTVQLLVAVIVVLAGDALGWIKVDKLELDKVKKFALVVGGFLGTLFANIKVLQYANVETFITFRSSTPLVLSVCDYIWLGRALPNARSWGCLVLLLVGSVGYVLVDADFRLSAYTWLALWYMFFTFDTVYAKHVVDTVQMTNWGRVFYGNFLALIPLAVMVPVMAEHNILLAVAWTPPKAIILALSCLMGVGMSHASYLLREAVSATFFTIIGILCKVLTVIINVFIWDKHASLEGIGCLMVCVVAGTFYQQAPRRQSVPSVISIGDGSAGHPLKHTSAAEPSKPASGGGGRTSSSGMAADVTGGQLLAERQSLLPKTTSSQLASRPSASSSTNR
ncbi:hypothetical protein HXX76_013122 [Chlamydomonas incerta]|uniref:Sugar phosphate transporter domain-containing protein n=1 Tax=Chlamydomonas incerta TaxID=51695 RepID=A0A835STI8_CHLIN|nr:hypothetical protein HXX76_013122 [Chlamydomonas incerta]|eukprot:KAG2426365.1 hypothetical protein HXX76_013122 [Chlamydomonas incerta]